MSTYTSNMLLEEVNMHTKCYWSGSPTDSIHVPGMSTYTHVPVRVNIYIYDWKNTLAYNMCIAGYYSSCKNFNDFA